MSTGNGTTIVFGLSSFAARVRRLGGWNQSIERLNDSDLGSTGYEEYIFKELKDHEPIDVEIAYDPDDDPPIGTVETITITFPSNATLAGTGTMISHTTAELTNNDRMVGQYQIAFDGKTGPTKTDAPP